MNYTMSSLDRWEADMQFEMRDRSPGAAARRTEALLDACRLLRAARSTLRGCVLSRTKVVACPPSAGVPPRNASATDSVPHLEDRLYHIFGD